jgi:hypothetical protein
LACCVKSVCCAVQGDASVLRQLSASATVSLDAYLPVSGTHASTTLSIVQGTQAEGCCGAGRSCRHALQWFSHLTVLWPLVTCPAVAALLAMCAGLRPLNCTANPVVTNGVFSCSTTAAGSTCVGSCNTGYTGLPSVTCNSNGTYSPVTGSCTGASSRRAARRKLHGQA